MMTGRNHSFFRADICRVVDLAGVGAVGTAFFNVLSEQHFPHLTDDYSVFRAKFLPHFFEIVGKSTQRRKTLPQTDKESAPGNA